jgi:hypothetical protein
MGWCSSEFRTIRKRAAWKSGCIVFIGIVVVTYMWAYWRDCAPLSKRALVALTALPASSAVKAPASGFMLLLLLLLRGDAV